MIQAALFKITTRNLLFAILGFLTFSVSGQEHQIEDLYGTWRNTGSFKNGAQALVALRDTIKNPTHYYFTFNKDGSFAYDVVSLRKGLKGTTRKGKWFLSPNTQRLTLIDSKVSPEKREIPGDFMDFENDGTLSTKPIIFPILELTKNKLVLYDEYHKTLDIYRK